LLGYRPLPTQAGSFYVDDSRIAQVFDCSKQKQ
jgi:hypothetical protein